MTKDHAGEDTAVRMRRLMALDKGTLPPDGGPEFNRLIFATSPYLLQHADNPVDWYEWGEEAFAKARTEDKPVFVSIGYATCHWCHVMAHESFEDPEVAAVFNRLFVCIKVDREERPDIDDHYMAVAHIMGSSGGWPLNIFMTPEKRPFYAATYIPRTQRMGLPGIIPLLERVAGLWREEREKLEENSSTVVEALGRLSSAAPGDLPDRDVSRGACRQLEEMYDGFWGGFGSAPKFPMPVYLGFLLRCWKRTGDRAPLAMVEQTLRAMRQGGIYDQLGFGFHRYAVDREWLVPHFEKMLYDQALIASVSLEAFQATGEPFYRQMAEEVFTFVLEEMISPERGFYTGLDADTEGEEGLFYLWAPAEVSALLGAEEAGLFGRLFDVTEQGNFEGRNVLHLMVPVETFASREGYDPEELAANVERWRTRLLAARESRPRPFRDEKVLTAWNGLMVAALAKGYGVTGDDRYLVAAARAVSFVVERLSTGEGRLQRSFHLGRGRIPAFLEDYAFFISGVIELHQTTLEPAFLDGARTLAGEMLRLFGTDTGALFDTANDGERLPVRRQSAYDGALPSGVSVAAFDLVRLGRIAGDESLLAAGGGIVRAFMGGASGQPLASLNLLAAAGYLLGPEVTITLAGTKESLAPMLRTIHGRFIPGLAVRHAGAGEGDEHPAVGGRPTAYVCAQGACRPPVVGVDALATLLDELGQAGVDHF